MKKSAVLNDQLSLLISQLGHTDTMAIADCGLPIPEATKRIDLSVTFGIPSFLSVLRTVLSDLLRFFLGGRTIPPRGAYG
jgi:D-ribose pyranase